MSYADILIPGAIGLLGVAVPSAFTKPTGDITIDGPRQKKFRTMGALLLGIAALNLVIKMVS
jgi:hypothetical protein